MTDNRSEHMAKHVAEIQKRNERVAMRAAEI
jgi:hypothetical protein